MTFLGAINITLIAWTSPIAGTTMNTYSVSLTSYEIDKNQQFEFCLANIVSLTRFQDFVDSAEHGIVLFGLGYTGEVS